jgi:hypothetical protein
MNWREDPAYNPQLKDCPECNGSGCDQCNGCGKVEDIQEKEYEPEDEDE